MRVHSSFIPIRTILIPFLQNGPGSQALEFARHMNAEILLVGVVVVPGRQSLSVGAIHARALRKQMRILARDEQITCRTQIIVSYQPWMELAKLIRREQPDLLCLEWDAHFTALGTTPNEVLLHPPCNVAMVHGKLPSKTRRVLVPMRGGPHAELALRVGLGLQSRGVTALHFIQADQQNLNSEAAFKGLDRILKQMPEVQKEIKVTEDAAKSIQEMSKKADVIVLGTTSQPISSTAPLGPFADRILHEAPGLVVIVKSARPFPQPDFVESAGIQAISILVDKWFAENTFHSDEFKDLDELVALKKGQGVTISLALPALNEEETVGRVVDTMKRELLDRIPLLDEIVLVDSNSTDKTREIVEELGVPVFIHQHLLEEMGARTGKGEALWKSLLVTNGDIIVWIDTDIVNIHPRFVYGTLGPLLFNQQVQVVKGFYQRPLKTGTRKQVGAGGRVTELTARPLINLFYPELSGIIQPLSGEYAGRRNALEQIPFFSGYGVETGLLIDVYERYGLSAIAQVDLLERVHHNQPLEALGKMSFAIIQTVIRKLENRFGRAVLEDVNRSMKLIRYKDGSYYLDIEEIAERERPPMIEVREYQEMRGRVKALAER